MFIMCMCRNNYGIFYINENLQGDQYGVFYLFLNGYVKCKFGEVEFEGIQFEYYYCQYNKQIQW